MAWPWQIQSHIDTTYLRPTPLLMKHTGGLHHDTLGVDSSLGEMRSRVDSLDHDTLLTVLIIECICWKNRLQYLCLSIAELAMSTEF